MSGTKHKGENVKPHEELIQYIIDRSDRKLDRVMVQVMVFWFLSVIVNKKKRYILVDNKRHLVNFYGLVFAKSNVGKSFVLNLLLELFDKDNYERMLITLFNERTKELPNGDKADTAMQRKFIKSFPPIKKDSTTQAIHKAAEAIGVAAFTNGSFNIYSDEFFANASEPILDMLVEGHDGIYKAPMIKGNKDEEFLEYNDIEDLTTNVLGLSSIAAIMKDQKALSRFVGEMERAWFKRSYIYFNDQFKAKAKESNDIKTNKLSNELKYLLDMSRDAVQECPEELILDEEAYKIFSDTRIKYINESDNSRYSNLLDVYKTLKLAAIITASDHRTTITIDDWNIASEFDKESFKQSENFCLLEHPHIRTYKELENESHYENELVEKGILPAAKKPREDTLELVSQLAYTKNKRLVISGSSLRKMAIDELETNKLDKMIVSTSSKISNKPEMEINFKSQEVKFFGERMTIESLVGSKSVQSFCLNHFEPTDKAPNGHRKKEYVITGQNMIAFDIDEGLSVEEAKEKLKEYIYIIYTTKSHQKDKNGIICDRFRVILPTKTMFYVDAEQHKGLYENLSKVLDVPSYDIATRNQGRLWYTNPETTLYKNETGELLDVRCCIPETEVSEHIIPNIKNIDLEEQDKRIAGMQKFVLLNAYKGNRNSMLFRLAKFIQEIGGNMDTVYRTNAMTSEPLPEREVQTIIKNLRS